MAKVLRDYTDDDFAAAVDLVEKSSSRQSQGDLIWSDSNSDLEITATQDGTASGSGECGKLVLNSDSDTTSLEFQRNVCNDENLLPLCMKTTKVQSRNRRKKKKKHKKKNLKWMQDRKMKKNRKHERGGRQINFFGRVRQLVNGVCAECPPGTTVDQCASLTIPVVGIGSILMPQPPPAPPPQPPPQPPPPEPLPPPEPVASNDPLTPENFQDFMRMFDKVYEAEELAAAEETFIANMEFIQAENSRLIGPGAAVAVAQTSGYSLAANLFADLTFAQFASQFAGLGILSNLGDNLGRAPEKVTVGALPDEIEPPREIDWSTGQCETPVTKQLCDSCAAHVRKGFLGSLGFGGRDGRDWSFLV